MNNLGRLGWVDDRVFGQWLRSPTRLQGDEAADSGGSQGTTAAGSTQPGLSRVELAVGATPKHLVAHWIHDLPA